MAFLQPWPMALARPAPAVRRRRQSRIDRRRDIDAIVTSLMVASTSRWHRRRPARRRGTRGNHARPVQVSRGSEGDASRVAEELPAAELADVRVWRQRHCAECGRWQTHAGGRPRARGTFDKLVTDPSTSTLISGLPVRSAARRERRCHESCSGEVAPRLASDGCDGPKVLAKHRSTGPPRGGGRSAGPVGVHRWWKPLPCRWRLGRWLRRRQRGGATSGKHFQRTKSAPSIAYSTHFPHQTTRKHTRGENPIAHYPEHT